MVLFHESPNKICSANGDNPLIKIGDIDIHLPKVNKLLTIYENRPTYDYLYWNFIHAVLNENGIDDASLIDVGANIGDTIAHFRRLNDGPAIGVEPHDEYFALLQKNMGPVANVTTLQALVCPPERINDVTLSVNNGTGGTTLAPGAGTYRDATISTGELLAMTSGHCVFKTDTDGFDQIIIDDLISQMNARDQLVDIIAFEGPTQQQMRNRDYAQFLDVTENLCDLGYRILMLNNIGAPMAYPESDFKRIAWHMNMLTITMSAGIGNCPYFDFIAVAPNLTCDIFNFENSLGADIWKNVHPAPH